MEKWDSERIYLAWRSQRNTLKANRIRREVGQERKCSTQLSGRKICIFLLFLSCIARFQALRNSVSLTIRHPVLCHYQCRSFLLVTLFPKEPKKAAYFTGKGSTPHFKARRCRVKVLKLCQTKSNLVEILTGIILWLSEISHWYYFVSSAWELAVISSGKFTRVVTVVDRRTTES